MACNWDGIPQEYCGRKGRMKVRRFDPLERMAEKEAARRQDDDALVSGRLSPRDLNARNFRFQHLDFGSARILVEDNADFI